MVKSNIPSEDKYDLLVSFDEVLGLELNKQDSKDIIIPDEVSKLISERNKLRSEGDYGKADELRVKINELGYDILDDPLGSKVVPVRNAKR